MMQIIIPSLFLSFFGIFTIFGIRQTFLVSQLVYFGLSFIAYVFFRKIGNHFFRLNARVIYWSFITILVITFFIGLEVKGSKRWIDFYFYKFQASEFFKVFFILHLSEILTLKSHGNKLTAFFKSFLYFLIPTFIIFKQPDLGNAIVYAFIFFSMAFFSDFPKKYLLYLFGTFVATFPLSWFFFKSYQRERILSFLNPHLDTQGTAYNMIQAVITVGSGKFFGRGLGLGTQSRLYFLPENHTDFAFSSLIEQFGFFGGLLIIVCFSIIVYYLCKKIVKFYFQKTIDGKKNFLYMVGLTSYFVFQVIINISMNMGLLPVAGIALPFISYGGSSVLALLIGLALIP
ncbi:rod shape-determining protein RodA [Candidatus Roizmanbacteria bacterium]|nr:rod shape-determining protein RodA [Candidatus Roizmanbacteria bacterium]